MLKNGDKVTVTYRDATGEVIEGGWIVVDYDDGLVKLHRPSAIYRSGSDPDASRTIPAATKVFNMRSHGFLSAEIVP